MSSAEKNISCLLPVKNGQDYLNDLLPRILDMLEFSDELIIINDGSTDNTFRIVESFMSKDKRVKVFTTPGVGLVSALNLGVSESSNPWIARFDVDDYFDPSRLSIQRSLIADSIAVVFSDYSFISHSGHFLGTIRSAVSPTATLLSLISAQRTAHPVALINRKFLLASGGYLPQEFPAEDLGLWLRISRFGDLVSVPAVLLDYRLSGKSISRLNRDHQLRRKDQLIDDWVGWSSVYNDCISSLGETVNKYLSLEGGHQRILLHFRELKIVSNVLDEQFKMNWILKNLTFRTQLSLIGAGLSLTYWLILRKVYRIFQ